VSPTTHIIYLYQGSSPASAAGMGHHSSSIQL
jgi:hypothetical protein